MPTLAESYIQLDRDKWEPVTPGGSPSVSPPGIDLAQYTPFLRCPMPLVQQPDSQRQFYRQGNPFNRILTP